MKRREKQSREFGAGILEPDPVPVPNSSPRPYRPSPEDEAAYRAMLAERAFEPTRPSTSAPKPKRSRKDVFIALERIASKFGPEALMAAAALVKQA